jgi:hypothetical protein
MGGQDTRKNRNRKLFKKLGVYFLTKQDIDQNSQQGQREPPADLEPPVIFA